MVTSLSGVAYLIWTSDQHDSMRILITPNIYVAFLLELLEKGGGTL